MPLFTLIRSMRISVPNVMSKLIPLIVKQNSHRKHQKTLLESSTAIEEEKANDFILPECSQPQKQEELSRPVQKNKKKCWTCRKKIGLLGFKCKCEYVFCKKHRIPEEHSCSFDFRKQQREKLTKQNPRLHGNKMQKI